MGVFRSAKFLGRIPFSNRGIISIIHWMFSFVTKITFNRSTGSGRIAGKLYDQSSFQFLDQSHSEINGLEQKWTTTVNAIK